MDLATKLDYVANKLAKWRMVFTGWQLGTRAKGDPESDAIRDHREATILLRAEVSALTKILLDKKICTVEDFQRTLIVEMEELDNAYERRFPGIRTTDMSVDYYDLKLASQTMRGWLP